MIKALLYREWLLAVRKLPVLLQPVSFLLILITIFPIAVGAETTLLQQIAPGVIWVGVLLSVLLSSEHFYQADYQDGTIAQWYLAGNDRLLLSVLAKLLVQSALQIIPVLLLLPILSLFYTLPVMTSVLIGLTILLGGPCLVLLAMLGAAITVAVPRAGLLLIVIILPLYFPVIIFAISAMRHYSDGFSPVSDFALLGALLLFKLTLMPFAIVAALKTALSES
ncbi:heme exporter protein CcmB [Ostreibacterium oceani]|uniref:Heme exporter protein B n=1 Tax=Ostreibacterium oceani TaxID=2654998 RepID=A0A6N7F2D0_9GAMM|nr:heme exporter protein CcmB [Ostreibacterium oceani]MPV86026.1 heme exporter protein CcmB [Ostreibacterium oceani]